MKKLINIISIIFSVLVLIIITSCGNDGNGPGEPPYIPLAPSYPSPEKGSTICDTTPLLNWEDFGDASEYQIQVDVDENFTNPIIDEIIPPPDPLKSEYQIPEDILTDGVTYYWRVKAKNGYKSKNGDEWGDWSNTWNFTIDLETKIPAIPNITNGEIIIDTTPLLDWEDIESIGDPVYQIQVNDEDDFSEAPLVNVETLTQSYYQLTVPLETLENNTVYYWRVRVKEVAEVDWYDWSNTWLFVTHLEVPSDPSPPIGGPIFVDDPLLSWEDIESAEEYRIQVSENDQVNEDGDFITILINTTTIVPQYQIGMTLNHMQTYYWHVRIKNEDDVWGDWSDWRSDPFSFYYSLLRQPEVSCNPYSNIDPPASPAWEWVSIPQAKKYRYSFTDGSSWEEVTEFVTKYTPSFALGEGPHTLYVQSGDDLDNWSTSGSDTMTIDTINPDKPSPDDGIPEGWTNNNDPTFTWSEPDDGVPSSGIEGYWYQLDGDGEPEGEGWTPLRSRSYSDLDDGQHIFYVQARDWAGNLSGVGSHTIDIDARAPTTSHLLSGDPGLNGWYISNVTVTLNASDPSPSSGIVSTQYRIDGGGWQTYSEPFVVSGSAEHTVYYYSVDNAVNPETEKSVEVNIDTTNPGTPSLDDGEVGWTNNNVPTFTWSATDTGSGIWGYYYELDGDGTPDTWTTGTSVDYSTIGAISDGPHTFYVQARDWAGNLSGVRSHEIWIDSEDPTTSHSFTSGTPGENGWWISDVEVTLSASDPSPSSGMDYTRYRIDSGGEQTYSEPFVVSGSAEHTVYYYSVDNAVNPETEKSVEVNIDTTNPGTPSPDDGIEGWTYDNNPTFTWSEPADTGSGIEGYYYELDGDGTPEGEGWTTSTSRSESNISDGTHTFYVQARDLAGNLSGVGSHEIKIDLYAAHWKFDEESGTVATDSSGNGNHGTLKGDPSLPQWVPGKVGNALEFDGEDDYVEVTNNSIFNADQFTIAMWLYPVNDDSNWAAMRRVGGWHLRRLKTDDFFEFITEDTDENTVHTISSGYEMPDQEWHHYAVVVDNTATTHEVTFYVNGELIGDTHTYTTGFSDSDGDVYIGQWKTGWGWHGRIDDVRFYSVALSEPEILNLSQMGN